MSEAAFHARRRNVAISIELPLLAALAAFCWWAARSQLLQREPELISLAIMFDLTVTASCCHWLLGIRRAALPLWTFLPLLAGGLALSDVLLPDSAGDAATLALLGVAVVECTALTFAAVKLRKIVHAFRAERRAGSERFDAFERALLTAAPSAPWLASYARFELQVWTMFAIGWFLEKRPADGSNVFTHHRASSWSTIIGVLVFMTVVEGAVLHCVLHMYHFTTIKWIMSGLSFYAVVWLLGDLQALRVYRSSLHNRRGVPTLDLRMGARGHAQIPLRNISSVEVGSWDPTAGEARLVLHGKANVKLSFHAPNAFKPMFGAEQQVRSLLTQVDDPDEFARALRAHGLSVA
jgi:hypothetical protein